MKKPGLGLARRAVEPRRQPVDRGLIPLQEKIGFGDSEVDELAVIAAHLALQGDERRARIRVAARAVQLHGSAEIQFVALPDDDVAERLELGARRDGRIGQRKLVVDPQQRFRRLAAIAEHPRRLGLSGKDLLADRCLVGGELLVDRQRAGVIAERRCRLRLGERRRNREMARRLACLEGAERLTRICGAAQPELRDALVVGRIVGKRAGAERRAVDERQRAGVVPSANFCCRVGQWLIYGRGSRARCRLGWDKPHIADARRQLRMCGGHELTTCPARVRAHEYRKDNDQSERRERDAASSATRGGFRRRAHTDPPSSAESPSASVWTSSCWKYVARAPTAVETRSSYKRLARSISGPSRLSRSRFSRPVRTAASL